MKISELVSGSIRWWEITNRIRKELEKTNIRFEVCPTGISFDSFSAKTTDWRSKTRKWRIKLFDAHTKLAIIKEEDITKFNTATLSYNNREITSSDEFDDISAAITKHLGELQKLTDLKIENAASKSGNIVPLFIPLLKKIFDDNGYNFKVVSSDSKKENFTVDDPDQVIDVGATISGTTISARVSGYTSTTITTNIADPSFTVEGYATKLIKCIEDLKVQTKDFDEKFIEICGGIK